MDTRSPVVIGYSGSLEWNQDVGSTSSNSLLQWFWTYRCLTTDPSTRSAFYLMKAFAHARFELGMAKGAVKIELWGKIDSRYQSLAESLGIADDVNISGYLSKAASLEKTNQCDVLFLPMESPGKDGQPLFIPGKAYEYLNARKPILAFSESCDAMNVLQPSGLLVKFGARAVEEPAQWLYCIAQDRALLNDIRPDDSYIAKYSFREITGQLADVFNKTLNE
jgi:glycosyltransferase involved in cell wall biosynthesis